ncbi:MAG: ATP-binding cassette domain-containing protein [Clostridia bacterium]|nr:ATP-binding cassette domain-containing protein [Clostridia bacterium]
MIELQNLTKTFHTADGDVEALRDVNLTVSDGDIFGIIGMSGAGKSTLVRCINLLERPTDGKVLIDGVDMGTLSNKELRMKRREITMIFQSFNLLMQRSCLKNICFPLELSGVKRKDAEKRAMELLEVVGLPDKAKSYPAQLSGGQQQRIAIARALATEPKVLLCDEATSALDPKTTHSILSLIKDINEKMGITVIVITHQMSVVEDICTNVAILDNGTVAEVGRVTEVFASPKSDAAKRLVFPEGFDVPAADGLDGHKRLRVVFNGADAATTPLIAQMALDTGVSANIMSASTKTIDGLAFGTMLLSVPGTEELRTALDYISREENVLAEEVRDV